MTIIILSYIATSSIRLNRAIYYNVLNNETKFVIQSLLASLLIGYALNFICMTTLIRYIRANCLASLHQDTFEVASPMMVVMMMKSGLLDFVGCIGYFVIPGFILL